ncbi:Hypothetical predicted protein, partial [Lynx pardinus]
VSTARAEKEARSPFPAGDVRLPCDQKPAYVVEGKRPKLTGVLSVDRGNSFLREQWDVGTWGLRGGETASGDWSRTRRLLQKAVRRIQ